MKNGEVWLVNFEPQVGQEIKKPGQQSSLMLIPLGYCL